MKPLILSRQKPSYPVPAKISGLVQEANSAVYSQKDEMLKYSGVSPTNRHSGMIEDPVQFILCVLLHT